MSIDTVLLAVIALGLWLPWLVALPFVGRIWRSYAVWLPSEELEGQEYVPGELGKPGDVIPLHPDQLTGEPGGTGWRRKPKPTEED